MHTKCLYTKCIPYFDKLLYTFCMQKVYKMYTECLYTKCIPHFNKLLYTFCIQNLADIVLLTLYTKCIQKLVEMWYTFCIHFVYISCIHLVQLLYTKYIHSFCVGAFCFFSLKQENLAENFSIPVSLVDLLQ